MGIREQILEEAKALQPEIVEKRRFLHQHPEIGFELYQTRQFVMEELTKMGYKPESVGKCGVVVKVGGKKPGKCILLRADMDALAMTEEAEIDYKSLTEGKMHGCGHDMHAAMLLGAAKLLKGYEDQVEGTIKLVFQPAEEIFQGSLDMIENGVLENPKVDGAVMIHVVPGLQMSAGSFLAPNKGGISMNTCEQYKITVYGKGGHGSTPQNAIDPITAAAQIHLALQEIKSRELSQEEYGVFTTGKFQAGTASNVIPDYALMEGTIRTADTDRSVNRKIKQRIEEISTAIATAFRCRAEVAFSDFCPCMQIDDEVAKEVFAALQELFGQGVIPMEPNPGGGSEDFSFISREVPTTSLFLAAGNPTEGFIYGQHHPKVIFDEACLWKGSAAYAYVALHFLQTKEDC